MGYYCCTSKQKTTTPSSEPETPSESTMKAIIALLCLAATVVCASSEEQGRFITIDQNGATLAINSTSFIYAAVIGIPLIIAAMIVLPFFGLDYEKFFNKESKDYDYTSGFDQDFSSYSSYAQRSLNTLTPIIKAIDQAYRKYK